MEKNKFCLSYTGEELVCTGEGTGGKTRLCARAGSDGTLEESAAAIVRAALTYGDGKTQLEFDYDTITENRVPVLLCWPQGGQNMPMVLINHGTGGCTTHLIELGVRLAQRGCFAVMVDARLHGRRLAENFQELFHTDRYKNTYLHMLLDTCEDFSALIDYFEKDSRVDGKRIGITGISQGGYLSFMAITKDKRIRAAAPMIGSPDLEDKYGSSPDFEDLEEAVQKLVIAHSPLRNYEKMYPTALLVQNGDNDLIVPVGGCRRLDEKIRPLYQSRGGVYEYIEYPGLDHSTPPQMQDKTVEWLCQQLGV